MCLLYFGLLSVSDVQQSECIRNELRLHVLIDFGVIVEGGCMIYLQQIRLEFLVYQDVESEQLKT